MNIGIYIYDQAEVLDFSGPEEAMGTNTWDMRRRCFFRLAPIFAFERNSYHERIPSITKPCSVIVYAK